jgi:phosphoglucosamine mutase
MSNRKYFGTDGIRGRVGDAPITPEFVLKLGWAAGKVLARHGSRKIIIGKDTRISGYMLESALEAGLAAAGLSASFTGPMPTPAVAYLTRAFRAEAGLSFQLRITRSMTTASNSSPLKAPSCRMT